MDNMQNNKTGTYGYRNRPSEGISDEGMTQGTRAGKDWRYRSGITETETETGNEWPPSLSLSLVLEVGFNSSAACSFEGGYETARTNF